MQKPKYVRTNILRSLYGYPEGRSYSSVISEVIERSNVSERYIRKSKSTLIRYDYIEEFSKKRRKYLKLKMLGTEFTESTMNLDIDQEIHPSEINLSKEEIIRAIKAGLLKISKDLKLLLGTINFGRRRRILRRTS